MRVFDASLEQMLWPEKRRKDDLFVNLSIDGPGVGWIQRTTADSWIRLPKGYVPDGLRGLLPASQRLFPMFFRNGDVEIGPIPQGTPVSLLSSADLIGADLPDAERRAQTKRLVGLLKQITRELKRNGEPFSNKQVMESLLSMSECPDLVINKGHYFGTNYSSEEPGLSDADKRALIGFLKTM